MDAFLTAVAATGRSACTAWCREQGVRPKDPTFRDAVERWRALPLLSDPQLPPLARRALAAASRGFVDERSPFPCAIWYGGVEDIDNGHRFLGTVGDFLEHVLVARSREVAKKCEGWVVLPVATSDGRRVSVSTTAVYALNLDCDARGPWDRLLAELAALNICHIAYQSGGWTPTTPKWHLLIPLASPYPTGSREAVLGWRDDYARARVALGTLGALTGEGFDPRTDVPCIPTFITERRLKTDPQRQVVFRPGHALDMTALRGALPQPPTPPPKEARAPRQHEVVALDDARMEEIVSTLAAAANDVPSGRRDLYLALPGALLDRGLDESDVLDICEAVSSRYPRPDDKKHTDNVRAARTTIAKWQKDEPVTQIGTLVDLHPEVALALDKVIPNRDTVLAQKLLASFSRTSSPTSPAAAPHPPSVDITTLRRRLSLARSRKTRSTSLDNKIRGLVLDAVLRGDDIVPRMPDASPAPLAGKPCTRPRALQVAMSEIASVSPLGTPVEAVRELVRAALYASRTEGEKMTDLLAEADAAYMLALGRRIERERERVARGVKERLRRAAGA